MTIKQILIKLIVSGFSLSTSAIVTLYILDWDIHNALYSVFWDYQFIKIYALISVTIFISLNTFRQIENLFIRSTIATSNSNLGGLYLYILATFIYLIFIEFIFDFNLRVYGLAIPIGLTTLGFNLNIVKNDSKETARKKVLIMANIILLIFWSMTTIYLTRDLESKKIEIEDAKLKLKLDENRYAHQIDSMWSVFEKNMDVLENDSLDTIIVSQLKLHSAFKEYYKPDDYMEYIHLDYLLNYEEMRNMLIFGLIMVFLLNCLYLIYLIRDWKDNNHQHSV